MGGAGAATTTDSVQPPVVPPRVPLGTLPGGGGVPCQEEAAYVRLLLYHGGGRCWRRRPAPPAPCHLRSQLRLLPGSIGGRGPGGWRCFSPQLLRIIIYRQFLCHPHIHQCWHLTFLLPLHWWTGLRNETHAKWSNMHPRQSRGRRGSSPSLLSWWWQPSFPFSESRQIMTRDVPFVRSRSSSATMSQQQWHTR